MNKISKLNHFKFPSNIICSIKTDIKILFQKYDIQIGSYGFQVFFMHGKHFKSIFGSSDLFQAVRTFPFQLLRFFFFVSFATSEKLIKDCHVITTNDLPIIIIANKVKWFFVAKVKLMTLQKEKSKKKN